jgi:hypothetical protein
MRLTCVIPVSKHDGNDAGFGGQVWRLRVPESGEAVR